MADEYHAGKILLAYVPRLVHLVLGQEEPTTPQRGCGTSDIGFFAGLNIPQHMSPSFIF